VRPIGRMHINGAQSASRPHYFVASRRSDAQNLTIYYALRMKKLFRLLLIASTATLFAILYLYQ